MKMKLLTALLILSATFVAWYMGSHVLRGGRPAEVLSRNEKEIRQYIANIQLGKIPKKVDGRGFLVLKVLGDNGVRYVEQNGNCIVITFGFMPTDSVPQLWYSPSGFSPLPAPIQELKTRHKVFEWHRLQNDWGYCEWDN